MNDESTRLKAENLFKNGISELKENNFLKAKDYFLQANKLIPDRISILYNLAFTYYHLNENQNAKKILKKIILIDKNDFDTIKLFIIILLDENRFDEVLKIIYTLDSETEKNNYKEILELFYKISSKLLVVGDIEINKKFYERYLSLDEKNLEIYLESLFLLPSIYLDSLDLNVLRTNFQKNLEKIRNLNLEKYNKNNFLPRVMTFFLSYNNENNLPILKTFTENIAKVYPELSLNLNLKYSVKSSKIRIGFVSEFLTDHTIGKLFSNLILDLDPNKFDVIVFHSLNTKEGFIKKIIDLKIRTISLPLLLNDKIKILQAEHLDIIFYPDIGMSGDLYYLTFYRLAKFQINSLGHPETSGNKNIDFFISNQMSELTEAGDFYSEKLIKFNNFNIYCNSLESSNKGISFNFPKNKNIYFCPQTIFKLVPEFDEIIKNIIKLDKKSVICFIKDPYNHQYKIFLQRLKNKGINLDQILIIDRLSEKEFINLSAQADILLDPLYFGAGNSFIETFLNPCPLITYPSKFLRSRIAMGLYKQLNIENPPVYNSIDDYIFNAVEIVNDKKKNNLIREQIFEKSKFFFRNKEVLIEYENFFLKIMNEGNN
jgi:predicted O-linked N-acetylglucosamine transferase (SPINDLY family)